MSKKNFKIKPKVWPKEYSFEEFKQLNPTIAENLLINYYNKYLQEYAEDRSRHLNHFEDTKDNLSKELNLLNEKLINNSQEWSDGDINVGPAAAARKYRSPLEGNFHSVQFDHTDDYAIYNENQNSTTATALPPRQGSIRPTEEITVLAWVNGWDGNLLDGAHSAKTDTIVGARDYNDGYLLEVNYRRIYWRLRTNAPGTGAHDGSVNLSTHASSNVMLKEDKIYFREQHPGWMFVVATFDGRYAKLYQQGLIATGTGETSNTHTDYIADAGSDGHTICYQRSSNLATYGSSSYFGGVVVGGTARYRGAGDNSDKFRLNYAGALYSGSIGEVAIWDRALDADTIMDIYSGSKGPYEKKYDLKYPGGSYDIPDEGIEYTNVGQYASNLQAWWRFEEGTGTTIKDYSGKNRDMTLNGGIWDSTIGVSASASPGV